MRLDPTETRLTGRWIDRGGKAVGDATCQRIDWLVANHLEKLAISSTWGAWETLFRDPDDGRFWERTYPQGEMHGGGPPEIHVLTADEAREKYGEGIA